MHFWIEIQNIFKDVVRLKDQDELIVLFMIDQDGELYVSFYEETVQDASKFTHAKSHFPTSRCRCSPLCIENRLGQAFTVNYSGLQGYRTEGFQHVKGENYHTSTAKSTNDSGQNLLTPLTRLYGAVKEMYNRLSSRDARDRFRHIAANARYYSVMLIQEIEQRERIGLEALVDGIDRGQIMDILREWDQKVPRMDYENICWNMLPEVTTGGTLLHQNSSLSCRQILIPGSTQTQQLTNFDSTTFEACVRMTMLKNTCLNILNMHISPAIKDMISIDPWSLLKHMATTCCEFWTWSNEAIRTTVMRFHCSRPSRSFGVATPNSLRATCPRAFFRLS